MKIYVSGKITKLSRIETKAATSFFAELLMSQRLIKNLTIKVKYIKDKQPRGLCVWMDNNIRPKEFEIELSNKFGRRSLLISLAHEMVHVKQYTKGELIDLLSAKYSSYSKFRNINYNTDEVEYFDQPWEIEAYGRELGLYERYITHLKNNK